MTIFYDFNIAPKKEIINTLDELGFSGACIFYDSKQDISKTNESFDKLSESTSIKLYKGICIDESNPQILRKTVQRFHKKTDFIMANGGDSKINRAICELPQVDIINHPYANKRNSGINHILAKMLVSNNISVNINFTDILSNRGYYKARILNQINQLLLLQRKYNFRTILSSGSKTFYDVRSPESMILLSQMMDMDTAYGEKAISENPSEIIKNMEKNKDSIIDGVRIIKD
ncbi:ribonuclease P protein component 3 [Methanosphaera sp.]